MSTIRHIAVHHSGGYANNYYGSSFHLTWREINSAHKQRWNFPSQHIKDSYGGYNFIYDPKNNTFHQFRAIGEETAAQLGYNFDTISICIIGNYSLRPGTKEPVDPLTKTTVEDIAIFINDLLTGNHGYLIKPGTTIDLSPLRVFPHRHYQKSTECYGTAIKDSWIQEVLSTYKVSPTTGELEKRLELLKLIYKLKLQLASLLARPLVKDRLLGASPHDRECDGRVELTT